MPRIRIQEINSVALFVFIVCILAGIGVFQMTHQPAYAVFGGLLGLYFLFAIKIVRQWEKVAVLRLGRYVGLRGPGLCHIIPIVETLSPYVDQRVRVASVSAESALTRDTVPVTSMQSSFGWSGTPRNVSLKSKISCRQSPLALKPGFASRSAATSLRR